MAPVNGASTMDVDVVGWVSDPNGRGTSSLILSCLLTLGLCVWSALHLNIPAKNETSRQYWLRRVKWSVCGILIPEIVVLLAWRQRTSAGRLTNEINKGFEDIEQRCGSTKQEKSTPNIHGKDTSENESCAILAPRNYRWTNVHSFYAGAGGFVFELEESKGGYGKQPFIPGPRRLTLTAHGVLLLAKCGLLPDLDELEIKDKSKQDALAKALVLLQAGWMLIQTMGRMATHIPTSLLEVNTIGHILCAFIVYLLWWQKPREIHEPTVLKGEWVDSICAYMYMSSRVSGIKTKGHFKPRSWVTPELKKCIYHEYGQAATSSSCSQSSSAEVTETLESHAVPYPRKEPIVVDIVETQLSGVLELQPTRHLPSQKTVNRKLKLGWTPVPSSENPTLRTNRYALAAEAVQKYPAIRSRFTKMVSDVGNGQNTTAASYEPVIEQLVGRSARNWPSDFLLPGLGGELMGMTLWLATMAYGGVHMAAWHEFFPTRIEQQMWRFSSLYIGCSGLLWLLMNVIGASSNWASGYWDRFIALQASWVEYLVYGLSATVCGIAYIFARAFLVVEGVVSLRRLPAQIYSTPQWTEVIPHL